MSAGTTIFGAVFGILGIVFLVLGLYWLPPALKLVQTALLSIRWPSVEGHVVSTAIHTEHYSDTEMSSTHRRGVSTEYDYYRPIINYKYQIDGRNYSSNQQAIGDPVQYANLEDARKVLKKFRADQPIKVYYDPKNHGNSVLASGRLGPSLRKLGTSLLMLFLAWYILKITAVIFS